MNIVITGGTKGIGRAIVEEFAAAGFDIITCSRSKMDLNKLKKQIEKKYKVACHVFETDFYDRHRTHEFFEFVDTLDYKQIDILVNNAGVFIPGSLFDVDEFDFDESMQVNTFSAVLLTRYFRRMMLLSKKAHVFNICSVASIGAYQNGGAYSVSKYAMLGFSRNLREEYKKENIRVTAVIAGATWSDSWKNVTLPKERLMPAADIAQIILATYQLSKQSVVEDIVIRPMQGDLTEKDFK